MPEMTFAVRWPDGQETSHYSPSLVLHDFLQVGDRFPVTDFVGRTEQALGLASERVRAKYGVACTSALHTQEDIVAMAGGYPVGDVEILTMAPPLPGGAR